MPRPRYSSIIALTKERPLRLAVIFTLLFVTVVHGLLLANDGVFWDGWIIYGLYLNKNSQPMLEMFQDAGNPGFGLFHYLMWQSPLPFLFSYKLAAFVSMALSSALLTAILLKLEIFTALEALFITFMTACYSAFQVSVEISIIPYLVCQSLFMIGAYLTLFPFRTSRQAYIYNHVAAAVCFLISFNLASLIVLYFALVPPLILLHFRKSSIFIPKDRSQQLRVAAYLALPVFFVVTKNFWGKSSGLYRDYNQIRLDLSLFNQAVAAFIDNSIVAQFSNAAVFCANYVLMVAILALVLMFASRIFFRDESGLAATHGARDRFGAAWSRERYLGLYALLVLFLGVAPYALVGKPPLGNGWETRHALLIGFPVALGLVVLGRVAQRLLQPQTRMVAIVGMLLIAAFSGVTWRSYALWELRWIKDRSTIAALSKGSKGIAEKASYVFVDDPELIHNQQYFFYEYSGMLKVAFNREAQLGNTAAEETNLKRLAFGIPLDRYLLKDFDGRGCSVLVVKRFQYPLTWSTVAKYYAYSLTDAQKLEQFLVDGTELTWSDVSQQRQADLRTMTQAIEAYKRDHGKYPRGPADNLEMAGLSKFLVPDYLPAIPNDPRFSTWDNVRYIYFSDGKHFKIIAHNPEDFLCATRLHPEMEDPRRPGYAYGFWSPDAKYW